MLIALETQMSLAFQTADFGTLNKYITRLPSTSPLVGQIIDLTRPASDSNPDNSSLFYQKKCDEIADLLWDIRTQLISLQSAKARLAMIDLSIDLEVVFFRIATDWQTQTVYDLVEKNYVLLKGLAGCGFLEVWEWENTGSDLSSFRLKSVLDLKDFIEIANCSRRLVERFSADLNRWLRVLSTTGFVHLCFCRAEMRWITSLMYRQHTGIRKTM
jgi:hypothetical protein